MNEKESATFVSSNLSVPTSLLTTTLRTDIPFLDEIGVSAGNLCGNDRIRTPEHEFALGLFAASGFLHLTNARFQWFRGVSGAVPGFVPRMHPQMRQ